MSEPPNIPPVNGPPSYPGAEGSYPSGAGGPYPGAQGQFPAYPAVPGHAAYPPLDPNPNKPDIGAAFSWAWATLRDNLWPVLLPGVLFVVGIAVAIGIYAGGFAWAFSDTQTVTDADGNSVTTGTVHGAGFILVALAILLMVVVALYLSAALIAGAFRALDGEPITTRTFTTTRRFWPLLLVNILVGLCITVGLALCVVPGLIFIVMFQFAPFFVVDRGLSPVDAMRESWNLARRYVGDSILIYLAAYGINAVGVFLCYIGAIVTLPLSLLFHACTFRQMTGGRIAGGLRTVPEQQAWAGPQQGWPAPPQQPQWPAAQQGPQWPQQPSPQQWSPQEQAPQQWAAPQPPAPQWPQPPAPQWPQQPPQPGWPGPQPPQPGPQQPGPPQSGPPQQPPQP